MSLSLVFIHDILRICEGEHDHFAPLMRFHCFIIRLSFPLFFIYLFLEYFKANEIAMEKTGKDLWKRAIFKIVNL